MSKILSQLYPVTQTPATNSFLPPQIYEHRNTPEFSITMPNGPGNSIAKVFISPVDGQSNAWKWKCGKIRQQGGFWFSNLLSHVHSSHADQAKIFNKVFIFYPTNSLEGFLSVSDKATRIHASIDIVILGLYPFSTVPDQVLCRHIRHGSSFADTLMKYLIQPSRPVESIIAKLLLDKFSIIFDGWSSASTYYLGIFSSFPPNNSTGYATVLL